MQGWCTLADSKVVNFKSEFKNVAHKVERGRSTSLRNYVGNYEIMYLILTSLLVIIA